MGNYRGRGCPRGEKGRERKRERERGREEKKRKKERDLVTVRDAGQEKGRASEVDNLIGSYLVYE